MKKVIGIAMALLLVFAFGAWAEQIHGKIKSLDTSERVFALEDGTEILVAEGLSMGTLKKGASVTASYEERDGKKVATSIEIK